MLRHWIYYFLKQYCQLAIKVAILKKIQNFQNPVLHLFLIDIDLNTLTLYNMYMYMYVTICTDVHE